MGVLQLPPCIEPACLAPESQVVCRSGSSSPEVEKEEPLLAKFTFRHSLRVARPVA